MSKKQPKLTPWFPAHVKPARKGAYQLGFGGPLGEVAPMSFPYHWFDGDEWVAEADSQPTEFTSNYRISLDRMYRNAYWRGLAEEPK